MRPSETRTVRGFLDVARVIGFSILTTRRFASDTFSGARNKTRPGPNFRDDYVRKQKDARHDANKYQVYIW